jgi:hypothetical protein
MANRFLITTALDGFIVALKPSGKYNNCTISFKIPESDLAAFEECFETGLKWGESKSAGKRVARPLPKWDEEGLVKYSYGPEAYNPMFPWIDSEGKELDLDTDIRSGSRVRLVVDLKPWSKAGKIGVSFKIRGAQLLELVSGNQVADSGDLTADDVFGVLGGTPGFKQSEPNVRDARPETDEDAYEF